jgi:hypothetical protein
MTCIWRNSRNVEVLRWFRVVKSPGVHNQPPFLLCCHELLTGFGSTWLEERHGAKFSSREHLGGREQRSFGEHRRVTVAVGRVVHHLLYIKLAEPSGELATIGPCDA